jgi:hypothetical protein
MPRRRRARYAGLTALKAPKFRHSPQLNRWRSLSVVLHDSPASSTERVLVKL